MPARAVLDIVSRRDISLKQTQEQTLSIGENSAETTRSENYSKVQSIIAHSINGFHHPNKSRRSFFFSSATPSPFSKPQVVFRAQCPWPGMTPILSFTEHGMRRRTRDGDTVEKSRHYVCDVEWLVFTVMAG